MTDSPMLQAREIVAGYGERQILHGINLSISAGDFLGVIGPNGSGKSTLIKALTGVLPLQQGEVILAGQPLGKYTQKERAQLLAVVPQPAVPVFAFTVREMVEMGRHPHLGRFTHLADVDQQAIDEALALADIEHLADRTVDQLSSGELQRVTIARALAQRPKVLLLDEPTAHLDIGHQMDVFELLVRLSRDQQIAILCILHDLNLAAEYCQQVMLFSEGRVFAEGGPKAVITEANLRAVYGTLVRVESSPYSGQPLVLVGRAQGSEGDEA